ncbi:MAG: gliding motility protein GldM [Candidatus Marithrix sp.]
MAGKETPRQRMIAVMYLVLTALLALNVSKDVINAFVVVNENILESNENLSQKLQDIYTNFEKNYEFNKVKVKPFWDKAKEAKDLSNDMVKYIRSIRHELISNVERVSIDSAKNISVNDIKKKDENNASTNFFLGSTQDGSDGRAKQLKDKIIEYRKEMLELVDPINFENVNLGLTTSGPYYNTDGAEQNWETHFFYNTIIVADITILNKIITDIHNAEFDVVNLLHKSIGQGDFKFDRIEAKVLPRSNFVFIGDEYKAEIIVAAYDTSQSPEAYYRQGIDSLPISQYSTSTEINNIKGRIIIDIPARSEGRKKYAGFVRSKAGQGIIKDYHFSDEYIVAKPSYTISAIKMNVFYTSVDNPVSISISGLPSESLTPSISCGTLKRNPTNDDWIVSIPPGFTEAIINISVNINGIQRAMGSKRFRVKKLPNPIATIANKSSGVINREIMIAAGALAPKMPDDFEFDLSFKIISFTMTIQRGFKIYNFKSTNSYLTDEMVQQLKRTNRGQNVVFENIVVSDPDSLNRTLAPIILTIN